MSLQKQQINHIRMQDNPEDQDEQLYEANISSNESIIELNSPTNSQIIEQQCQLCIIESYNKEILIQSSNNQNQECSQNLFTTKTHQKIQDIPSQFVPKINEIIDLHIIKQVQTKNTTACRYLLFHIPYILILANFLTDHHELHLKQKVIRLYNREKYIISTLINQQCQTFVEEYEECLKIAALYPIQDSSFAIQKQLQTFLSIYEQKMKKLIGCYYIYFNLAGRKKKILRQHQSQQSINKLIEQTECKLKQFHNPNI